MNPRPPEQVFGIIDPDYARVFTQARILAWQHGFACLAHGSFTRDLDLLLVPWTEAARAEDVDYFAPRIAEASGLVVQSEPPSIRPHGRKTWTLVFPGFADTRWVDLSVMTPKDDAAACAQGLRERIAELEAQRVPLTKAEITACCNESDTYKTGVWMRVHETTLERLVRAIERAHGIEEVETHNA